MTFPSFNYHTKECHHNKITTMKMIHLPLIAALLVATTTSKDLLEDRAPAR